MEVERAKVYVALGNDLQDGLATLKWTLRKWSCYSISIVILHAPNFMNKGYVYSHYGKMPSSYVNDNHLEFLRRDEQEKMENILHQFIAFCGQVKAEIFKIDNNDEPVHKKLVELLSSFQITKLVMAITFMKSPSSKSESSLISRLRYLQQEKPDLCELFFISGGKRVFMREENNKGVSEDNVGIYLAKINKISRGIKGWLGKKMLTEYGSSGKSPQCSPSSSLPRVASPDRWEKCVEEIDRYFTRLLTLNVDQEDGEVEDDIFQNFPTESSMHSNLSHAQRTEEVEIRIAKARDEIQLRRKEAMGNVERCARAEWAISLGTNRAEEMEGHITEEMMKRDELEKELDMKRDELHEIQDEVEQKKSKLSSILELQQELSSKLKASSLGKVRAEVQLEKIVRARVSMVQEIERFRTRRDVIQRRIEFCREKDAIEMAITGMNGLNLAFKKFRRQRDVMVDPAIPPSIFLCPIYQETMTNPHIAEDGFSYELEAIERWLETGHNTSPMTNLQLKHKNLTPNHTLRALIHDWHTKSSTPFPQI